MRNNEPIKKGLLTVRKAGGTQMEYMKFTIQNGRVTADLDASSFEGSFIGARVRVLAPTGERRAIIVPSNYVVTRFGVDYVRLARGGGAIDAPIQLGARMPTADIANGVEVLSGLREGDQILPPRPGA